MTQNEIGEGKFQRMDPLRVDDTVGPRGARKCIEQIEATLSLKESKGRGDA
jgi:hypothetical protein